MTSKISRRFGWAKTSDKEEVDFGVQERELSEEAWDEFNELVSVTATLRPYVIDYLSLVENFHAVNEVEELIATGMASFPSPMTPRSVNFAIKFVHSQRALSNFLFSANAFRDRAKKRLIKLHGKTSKEAATFEFSVSEAHKKSFSFRIMSELRNFAQHQDIPVNRIPTDGNRREAGGMTYTSRLMLKPSELLGNRKIDPVLRREIENGPDEIEIIGLARSYMKDHIPVMRSIIASYGKKLAELNEYRKFIISRSGMPKGATPFIFENFDIAVLDRNSQAVTNCTFHDFSFDELDLLAALYKAQGLPRIK